MLNEAGRGTPIALMLLIPAQIFCAGFFLSDLLRDLGETGHFLAAGPHLHIEAFAAVTLVISVLFEIGYLLRLLRRKAHLEESLDAARAAVHEVIEAHFDAWGLTAAERDVATFLVKGFSTSEIARLRGSAEGTVKAHLHAIYRKSGARNRAEVMSVLIESLMGGRGEAGPEARRAAAE